MKRSCRYLSPAFSVSFLLLPFLALLSTAFPSRVPANENSYTITYAKYTKTARKYNEYCQIIFIRIPADMNEVMYVRLGYPKCGDNHNSVFSKGFEYGSTQFRLFGGKGACSNDALKKPSPNREDVFSGELLLDTYVDKESFRNDRWYTLAPLDPEKAEAIGTFRYYKLVMEGENRADVSPFLIVVSRSPKRNLASAKIDVFTYVVLIRSAVPGCIFLDNVSTFIQEGIEGVPAPLTDLMLPVIGIETGVRANLPFRFPEHDGWTKDAVKVNKKIVARTCSFRFDEGVLPAYGMFYVTDDQGRLLPVHLPVYHKIDLQLTVTKLDDCRSVLFDASRISSLSECVSDFLWDFGDATSGEGARITHCYPSPGSYKATLSVEDIFDLTGEVALDSFTVSINYPPRADAGPDLVGAPGEEVVFDGSGSTDRDGVITAYNWSFGDGNTAGGVAVKHTFRDPRLYTATLRVEDDSDTPCNSAIDQCRVRINAQPVVKIGGSQIASPGQKVRFSGEESYDSDGRIVSYWWDFGDGTRKSGKNVTHIYEKPGAYRVMLEAADNSGAKNSNDSDAMQVVVNYPPVAEAGEDQRASTGEIVCFDGSKSSDKDGNLIGFNWDFGDGTKDRGVTVSHAYEKPGRYWVTLTVEDDSGSTSDTDQDKVLSIINQPPIANARIDHYLSSSTVQFDGTGSKDPDGTIVAFLWDFGDDSKGEGPSPIHYYRSPGAYLARLTVTDDSKTSTDRAFDEVRVVANHLPIADAGPDLVGVPEKPLRLVSSDSVDPDGTIASFAWDFGDGSSGVGKNVLHRYSRPGTYSVVLTVRDNSGREDGVNFDEARVRINESPVAVAGDDLIIAPNETVSLDGSRSFDPDGDIVLYQWNYSDRDAPDTSASVFRSFSSPGIYSATLTVVDNTGLENSSAQDALFIRVNNEPEANAGEDIYTDRLRIVLDGSGSSDADGDPLSYVWDFGDGTPTERGEKVCHTYSQGGDYPVILTIDDGTGVANAQSTSSIRVKINEPPIADAGGNRDVCAGKVVIFDGSESKDPEGGVLKYHWDFGDGTSAWGVNPAKTYDSGGVYPVTLTVKDDSGFEDGDTSIDRIVVKVVESPVADAGEDQAVCVGIPVQFDGTGSRDVDGLVNDFQWDFGDGAMGGDSTPIHVYTKAGTYRVVLTVFGDSVGACDNTDRDEMVVTVHEGPIAAIRCPATVAKGESVVFDTSESTGSGGHIIAWGWDFGDGVHGNGEQCEHRYEKSGNYIATLAITTDSETDCNRSCSRKQVTVNESPKAEAGKDRLVGAGEVVPFNGSLSQDPDGAIASYRWDFGDGQTGNGVQVRHRYEAAGTYEVVLRVTDDTNAINNSDTDKLTVTVNEAPKPIITTKGAFCVGEEAILSAKGSTDSDGTIVQYWWNFGDGTSGEGQKVRHRYHTSGIYEVVLEVDDGRAVSNSRAQIAAAVTVNATPVANAGFDRIVSPGEEILFDGSASVDRDGSLTSFSWDFDDGSRAEGERVSHVYQSSGEYQVRLLVTDNSETECNVSENTIRVRVNSSPVAAIKAAREVFVGAAYGAAVFDATGSRDPEGDPLVFFWDFGDGHTSYGSKVTHGFKDPGQYTVKLCVDDGTGLDSSRVWEEIIVQVHQINNEIAPVEGSSSLGK